ncbi:MAG: insulinase family protein [Acidobacteria bacterium]|nr:insulinase family protein [Acidobacteriota bacterium]
MSIRATVRIQVWVGISVVLCLSAFGAQIVSPAGGRQSSGRPDQSLKGAILKGRAPVNKRILRVKLPRGQETTLENGLRVIVLEDHRVPTFFMQMVILSGGLSDPPDYHGLASFTASLLREGTRKRSSRQIAEEVESLGATLSGNSGLASFTTHVSTSGLIENVNQVLDIFADVIRDPTFPEEEVEKFRNRILSQLQFQRSIPQFLAQERFSRAIYGGHPAGLVTPSTESVKKTTPEELGGFHALHYRPNNAILAVVGDVTLKEFLPGIRRVFGDWKSKDTPKVTIPSIPVQGPTRIYLVDRPHSVQTVLMLGNLGIERTDPDYFPMLVMNHILGGGAAARLFMNLREEKGYTYGAYSSFSGSIFRGVWVASSEVRIDVTGEAMREFMNEFKRIHDEQVSPVELEDARRALAGSFALSLEEPQTLLQNILTQKLYNFLANYWDTYPQKVAAVSAQDIQRVARKYVDLDHLQVIAVGDASKVRDKLAQFGNVEVYDAEGEVVALRSR